MTNQKEEKAAAEPNPVEMRIIVACADGLVTVNPRKIAAVKEIIRSQIQQAQEDILEEVIKEINNVKDTSDGEQQWFDGLRVCRSIAETLKSKIKENKV